MAAQSKYTGLISPAVVALFLLALRELCSDTNTHTCTQRKTERSSKKIALFSKCGPEEDNVTMLIMCNIAKLQIVEQNQNGYITHILQL